jgi:hypothetical protein
VRVTLFTVALAACAVGEPVGPPVAAPHEQMADRPGAAGEGPPRAAPEKDAVVEARAAVASSEPLGPHLTSVRYKTWIWRRPSRGDKWIGYVRVGQRVPLKSSDTIVGEGCPGGFYAIEPRGYVCNDATVTLEESSPFLVANAHSLPSEGPHPYRYAISAGAPMYARLPTPTEQRRHEAQFGPAGVWEPLPPFSRGHEHLAIADAIAPTHSVPPFLAAGRGPRGPVLETFRRSLPRGTMISFTEAFDHEGRTFLLSVDLTVVPADRVRIFRKSEFRGVELGKVELPLAWIRARERPAYRFGEGGPVALSAPFPLRSFIALTGEKREHDGRTYLREKGRDRWIDADDATVVEPREDRPFGVGAGDKWILVSITQGTLVAYEDLTPVFTTLISPGLGGVPRRGGDLVKDSTTPLGTFRVTFKDRAATMAPEFGENRSFWIADVPFTQYFNAPFALHAAYWHERFGELMSGGCVNLSPLDAEHLFGWTDPKVPPGWQGIVGNAQKDEGVEATWVVVTR